MRFGVVTGLQREARLATRAGLDVLCLGPGPLAARAAAGRLAGRGATVLVSFGYAGGLDPDLDAGALVVPRRVVDETGRGWDCIPPPVALPAGTAAILGTDGSIVEVGHKRLLAMRAAAVDRESHAVAAVAAARGIGLLVVRAIVDRADIPVPPSAEAALGDDGRVRAWRLLAALASAPGEIPALLRLARATRAADHALRQAALALAGATRHGPGNAGYT